MTQDAADAREASGEEAKLDEGENCPIEPVALNLCSAIGLVSRILMPIGQMPPGSNHGFHAMVMQPQPSKQRHAACLFGKIFSTNLWMPCAADFTAVVLHQQRESGPAPPPRLTAHQRQIVERLIAAHGEDVQVHTPLLMPL